jgi:hypothetical protein
VTGFPDADPRAISALADSLQAISLSMADIGLETEGLRGSVMGSQQWQGNASEKWWAVVTDRIGDAGLSNDVMGSAASMLSALAADLAAERRVYGQLSSQLYSMKPAQGVAARLVGAVEVENLAVQRAMDACAARAAGLLDSAAAQLLGYAALAGDIHAVPVANRTPGVPDGANRQAASLQLLAMLFGSVTGNQTSGSQFEQAVLKALGIGKNTEIWRPDPAFEGKLTPSGLARGTIPDGQGSNFLVEIKGTSSLQLRFQLRLQIEQARLSGNPLWVIKASGRPADPSVVRATEGTNGGVLYTSDNGKTFTDGQGNPVQVSYDKASDTLKVSSYKPTTRPGGSGGDLGPTQSPDPDAPPAPVSPDTAQGPPAVPDVPVDPVGPEEPVDPVDPEILP